MSNVVKLEPRMKQTKRSPDEPRYFCVNCESDLFRNYADGRVCCGNCGVLIKNILIKVLV